jgi:hypothetical protein
MLNLEETLDVCRSYNVQRNLPARTIGYSVGAFFLVEYLRAQVPETNLIQLVPGYYLILVFCCFVYLVSVSDSVFRLPQQLDTKKDAGTKTNNKLELAAIVKFGVLLISALIVVLITTILPLSLDSFENYEDFNLDNLWSFDQVISLEIILTITVLTFSQFPNLAIFNLSTERDTISLPDFWRDFSFFTFVISGVVTPTIDGYTQLSFAATGISMYLVILIVCVHRINQKFSGSISLNF